MEYKILFLKEKLFFQKIPIEKTPIFLYPILSLLLSFLLGASLKELLILLLWILSYLISLPFAFEKIFSYLGIIKYSYEELQRYLFYTLFPFLLSIPYFYLGIPFFSFFLGSIALFYSFYLLYQLPFFLLLSKEKGFLFWKIFFSSLSIFLFYSGIFLFFLLLFIYLIS